MGTKDRYIYLLALVFLCQIISTTPSRSKLQFDRLPAHSSLVQRERSRRSLDNLDLYEDEFLEKLLQEYGTDGVVSVSQLTKLVKNIRTVSIHSGPTTGHGEKTEIGTSSGKDSKTGDGTHALEAKGNCSGGNDCQKCLSMVEIFEHHSLSPKDTVNGTKLQTMSPTILYQLQNPECTADKQPEVVRRRPSPAAVWGYGFLCVTFINLCALMGMVFLPLMRRSFYKNMLLFMVALAVGTLTGSGLLFLIPESFEMTSPDSPHADYYVWRSLTVISGIYLFFLVERLLKMIMKSRQCEQPSRKDAPHAPTWSILSAWPLIMFLCVNECIFGGLSIFGGLICVVVMFQNPKEKEEMQDMPIASVPTHSVHLEDSMNMSFRSVPDELPVNCSKDKNSECLLHKDSSSARLMEHSTSGAVNDTNVQMTNGHSTHSRPQHHGHSHGKSLKDIRSVAWMVIFGDGLHNFIDGLSIGAAFSGSIMTGLSVSLAVFFEELPHELGDFAILLNSGMTMKQALSYNFLSACMCYLGLIIGIIVGEATEGAVWIFAVAGGMFLYIALVDMLPEVNHAADEEEAATGSTWSIFLVQNAGLLTGIGIMVLLAVFAGKIDLSYLDT